MHLLYLRGDMTNHAFENVHGLKDPTHLDWGNTVARSAECAGAVSQDTLHHQTPELRKELPFTLRQAETLHTQCKGLKYTSLNPSFSEATISRASGTKAPELGCICHVDCTREDSRSCCCCCFSRAVLKFKQNQVAVLLRSQAKSQCWSSQKP